MTPWLAIVGIGADGIATLPGPAQTLIDNAEILIGGDRHLAMVGADHPAERHGWATPISRSVEQIRQFQGRRVVVLATGDPMSYGIGVMLARAFGRDAITILPITGAFSLAAARLGWPLHDIDCLSLHGRPLALLNLYIRPAARLLILGTAAFCAAMSPRRSSGVRTLARMTLSSSSSNLPCFHNFTGGRFRRMRW